MKNVVKETWKIKQNEPLCRKWSFRLNRTKSTIKKSFYRTNFFHNRPFSKTERERRQLKTWKSWKDLKRSKFSCSYSSWYANFRTHSTYCYSNDRNSPLIHFVCEKWNSRCKFEYESLAAWIKKKIKKRKVLYFWRGDEHIYIFFILCTWQLFFSRISLFFGMLKSN